MKILSEGQFFSCYAPIQSKWYVTLFGIGCLILGSAGSFGVLLANDSTAMFLACFYLTIGILLFVTRKWAISLAGTVYSFVNAMVIFLFFDRKGEDSAFAIYVLICLVMCALGVLATFGLYQSSKAYLAYLEHRQPPKEEPEDRMR